MLNTTLLIKSSENISRDKDMAKLLANKIMTGMRYYKTEIVNQNDSIYFIDNDDDKVYIELLHKEKNLWMVNIYNHKIEDKDILAKTIISDDTFQSVIVIFDSISNSILMKSYPLINEIENKLRSEFCFSLIENYNIETFDIIDNLNVKEEYRFDTYQIPKILNTKLQRFELSNLISYMNEHKLGGDEFKKYYDCFTVCNNERIYDEFEKILKTDIFKEVIGNIKKHNDIKNFRNAICHNNIINVNKFNEVTNTIITYKNSINTKYNESLINIYGQELSQINHILLILNDNTEDLNITQFTLKFSEILNICGYIYDSTNICKITEKNDVKNYNLNQCNSDKTEFRLNYKKKSDNKNGIYILCIAYDDNYIEQSVIAELRDRLISGINVNKIIILNDSISTKYCNELYGKINYIENIVRAYISLFYFFKDLDINKLSMGNNTNGNELLGSNNNSLYSCDFIELSNILDNPPESRKIVDLINQLRCNLREGKYNIIENRLKNISDANVDVCDILDIWTDLYKYRTIVAHSEYISKREFEEITDIVNNTLKTVEKVFFSEIYTIFEFSKKYEDDYRKKICGDKVEIDINFNNGMCTLRIHENIYDFEDIGMSRFQRLLRKIIDQDDNSNYSYTLTKENFENWIDTMDEKFENLLNKDNHLTLINDKIISLGYTKYVNHRVITNKEDLLEEKIGNLLKSIEKKVRNVEDEIAATKQ